MMRCPLPMVVILILGVASSAPAQTKKEPKRAFKSTIVEFTPKATPDWIFREAARETKVLSDRDYAIAALPQEMVGGTLLIRDSEQMKSWLQPGVLTATNDGTVYAVVRWQYLRKEVLDDVAFTKLMREGWEEVEDDFETTFPNGEDWRWKVLRKQVPKGGVVLQLKTLSWNKAAVLFVFKEKGAAKKP